AIPVGRNVAPRKGSRVNVRILIINVVGLQFDVAGLVLAVISIRFETNRRPTTATIVEANASLDIIGNWKRYLGEKRGAPGTQIGGRNRKTERIVERLIHVRPPEYWDPAHVKRHILKNDVIIFVNAHGPRPQVKVRAGGVVRSEGRIFH